MDLSPGLSKRRRYGEQSPFPRDWAVEIKDQGQWGEDRALVLTRSWQGIGVFWGNRFGQVGVFRGGSIDKLHPRKLPTGSVFVICGDRWI